MELWNLARRTCAHISWKSEVIWLPTLQVIPFCNCLCWLHIATLQHYFTLHCLIAAPFPSALQRRLAPHCRIAVPFSVCIAALQQRNCLHCRGLVWKGLKECCPERERENRTGLLFSRLWARRCKGRVCRKTFCYILMKASGPIGIYTPFSLLCLCNQTYSPFACLVSDLPVLSITSRRKHIHLLWCSWKVST